MRSRIVAPPKPFPPNASQNIEFIPKFLNRNVAAIKAEFEGKEIDADIIRDLPFATLSDLAYLTQKVDRSSRRIPEIQQAVVDRLNQLPFDHPKLRYVIQNLNSFLLTGDPRREDLWQKLEDLYENPIDPVTHDGFRDVVMGFNLKRAHPSRNLCTKNLHDWLLVDMDWRGLGSFHRYLEFSGLSPLERVKIFPRDPSLANLSLVMASLGVEKTIVAANCSYSNPFEAEEASAHQLALRNFFECVERLNYSDTRYLRDYFRRIRINPSQLELGLRAPLPTPRRG